MLLAGHSSLARQDQAHNRAPGLVELCPEVNERRGLHCAQSIARSFDCLTPLLSRNRAAATLAHVMGSPRDSRGYEEQTHRGYDSFWSR